MPTKDELHKVAQELGRKLTDQGKLIESGWVIFDAMTLPPRTSEDQRNDMRIAFFAGAQHLFGTIASIMDPGDEPTDADLSRMDNINDELTRFADFMRANVPPPPKRS